MINTTKIRTAATLIICFKVNSNQINYDYNVMLLKRSKNMKFASSNYVFPGGKFDKSDESLNWLNLFKNKDIFNSLLFNNISRPNVFFKNDNRNVLPPEIAYRLCAIRETFEETGLLIAYNKKKENNFERKKFSSFILDKELISKWVNKIRENSNEFINMFLEYNLIPDIYSLHEWSSWLTPSQEKNRFDTMFFTCFLDNKPNINEFEVNLAESQNLEFYEPNDALLKYENNEITFFPPQIYELTRLTKFNKINDLAEYSLNRQFKHGITTWLPKFVKINSNNYGILPGDDFYNLNDEIIKKQKLVNINRFLRTKFNNDQIKYKIESNILFNDEH